MANHARTTAPKPRAVIGTPWWIRLAIYVVVAVAGLVLTVLGVAQPEQVDSWLGQTGSIAALVGGLLAAVNTGRESDEKPVGVAVPDNSGPQLIDHTRPQARGPVFSVFREE